MPFPSSGSETVPPTTTPQDYNLPTPERVEFLRSLKVLCDDRPVPPAFWALCQFADTENLEDMCTWPVSDVKQAMSAATALVEKWIRSTQCVQRNGSASQLSEHTDEEQASQSGISETSSASSRIKPLRRSILNKLAEMRDEHRCVLRSLRLPSPTYIIPIWLFDARFAQAERDDFWKLVEIYWTKAHVERWKRATVTGPESSAARTKGCANLLSVSPSVRVWWKRGWIALKPIERSEDERELRIQFFWQPQYRHESDEIDLLTSAISSEGISELSEGVFLFCKDRETGKVGLLRSGQCRVLKTGNLGHHPLPNMDLLDLQWIFQRVVAMSGLVDWEHGDYGHSSDVSTRAEEESEGDSISVSDCKGDCSQSSAIRDWIPAPGGRQSETPPEIARPHRTWTRSVSPSETCERASKRLKVDQGGQRAFQLLDACL